MTGLSAPLRMIQDGKYYLMDVLRERLEYPSLRARAIELARAYTPNKILVEDAGIGMGLIQDLQKAGMPAVAVKPERNKKTRMQVQSDKFAAGLVFFPKYASWLAEYESELFAFPSVRFDDQVDSTSQALSADHSTFWRRWLARAATMTCRSGTSKPVRSSRTSSARLLIHLPWMAATLDGVVQSSGAVFESKFMLPWSFSEHGAAAKYMPQLQHNMWVVAAKNAVLSVITGGGKWVEIKIHADPLYQQCYVTSYWANWRG